MAPPPEPPTSITLRVKVPPGHVPGGADEFTLGSDIAVASKVGQIRERIQEAIPSSPTPERQRLLYGGRALVDNDQTVADALNIRRDPSQTEYVIHLLVKGDGANVNPVPHRTGMRTPGRSASPAAAAQPAAGPPTAAAPPQPAQNAALPQMPNPQQLHHQLHQQAVQQQMLQQQAAMFAQQRLHAPMFQNQGFHQPMMPLGMQPFAGHMPGIFPPGNGMPAQHFHAQGHQQPAHVNNQHAAVPQNVENGTPQDSQTQNEQNNGAAQSQQPPPRVTTHQNAHGHDVQVRIHQTVRIPNPALQTQQRPLGFPNLPHLPAQGVPTPQANANGRSALDQARENMTEMQRLIDELRNTATITESQQAQLQSLERISRSVNDYIDPFRVGNNRARSNSPVPPIPPNGRLPPRSPFEAQPSWQQRAQQIRQTQHQAPNPSSQDVTCYLLSSPSGPQALLYSPQHGLYTVQMPSGGSATLQPTPTVPTGASNGNATNTAAQPNQQAAQHQGEGGQQLQAQVQGQAAQQDPLGPLGPIMGHLWLLLRVLIFAYFLLGANMGWRRPLALFAIGMGFWMIRMGLLGDGGALRRWWDGIMNDGRAPPAQQQGQQGQNQQQGQQQGQPPAANARPGQMPTPEQLAQRLLDEDARARDQARDQRLQWVRERIRPVERAIALLVASLWPGVGEAYVRAREQEERQRAEEEIAARRREEEERQKKEEEEKQKNEGSGTDEKAVEPAETEATDAGASTQAGSEPVAQSVATSAA
ncbi:hypothetical protein M409DRAFT_58577 [Zasmidium cellare ATCC 36951]|uniref:Ubiquitin-like domain-containing protein n=1 Tax=Zasmidium cellare ATCC 36951 TaxID=1080233 RepID=A0A6A6C7A6_ZASCE|nr:uncharacterized protein M409DRAFT_58577 [Zasmidium cellare ATCC 36951]KAF2162138.1 hypothetical protein M409DRAFT_58577 [Zasmidium cellare ATCC 36951]